MTSCYMIAAAVTTVDTITALEITPRTRSPYNPSTILESGAGQ